MALAAAPACLSNGDDSAASPESSDQSPVTQAPETTQVAERDETGIGEDTPPPETIPEGVGAGDAAGPDKDGPLDVPRSGALPSGSYAVRNAAGSYRFEADLDWMVAGTSRMQDQRGGPIRGSWIALRLPDDTESTDGLELEGPGAFVVTWHADTAGLSLDDAVDALSGGFKAAPPATVDIGDLTWTVLDVAVTDETAWPTIDPHTLWRSGGAAPVVASGTAMRLFVSEQPSGIHLVAVHGSTDQVHDLTDRVRSILSTLGPVGN